jgi:hypothetical protein
VNAPHRPCPHCPHRHRLGRACPPPIPPMIGLDRLARVYWACLDAEMAEARSVDATGLTAAAA